jgi:mRNA interferase RelE/StbE
MWTIEFDERAQRELSKLDKPTAIRIRRFLEDRIAPSVDPRSFGHGLKHSNISSEECGAIASATTVFSAT